MAGINRKGMDISTVSKSSADLCEQACFANNTCKAWAYKAPSECHLKKDVPAWSPDAAFVSGVRPVAEPGSKRTPTSSADILKSAEDTLATHDNYLAPGPENCARWCAAEASCKAFTHTVNPDANHDKGNRLWGKCELYKVAPTATFDTGLAYGIGPKYYSGVKPTAAVASVTRTNAAGAIATTTPGSASGCANDCARDFRCQSFKYSGTTCTLFDSVGTPSSSSSSSSSVSAGALHSVSLPGVGINGDVIASHPLGNDCGTGRCPALVEKCRAECETNAACFAFRTSDLSITGPLWCTTFSKITEEFSLSYWDGGVKGLSAF
jgi:hypothetical protein